MEPKEATAEVVGLAEGDKGVGIGEVQVPTSGEGQQKLDSENIIGEHVEGEHVEEEPVEGRHVEGEHVVGENVEKEHVEGEHVEGDQTETIVSEHAEGDEMLGEHVGGEQVASEQPTSEYTEGEQTEGEQTEGEQTEGEQAEGKGDKRVLGEGEELMFGEQGTEEEEGTGETPYEEIVEEEEAYVEEPPPDPAAPFNFSDSQELLKDPFELRPDQVAEVEQLWDLYQNYNPAYSDLDGYITEKELVYMLKCLLLMTYTEEQLQELITFCVRPPHPQGHITYEQFLRMVTVRQRDYPIEEELRSAILVLDPERTGAVDREYLRDVLSKLGHKMPAKVLDHFIKEVDLSNDGTIGIEDVVGTMCIDLNTDDIMLLRQALFPKDGTRIEVAGDDDDDKN